MTEFIFRVYNNVILGMELILLIALAFISVPNIIFVTEKECDFRKKTIFVIESFWVTFESIIFLENVSHILGKKRYLLSNLSGYFLLCKMSQSALTLSKKKQKKNHLYSRLRLSSLKYLCTWHKIVLDYFAYDISIVSLTPQFTSPIWPLSPKLRSHCLVSAIRLSLC